MGHVDDAHQTESDGEAERGDEENGGETETSKGGADEIAARHVRFDRKNRLMNGLERLVAELWAACVLVKLLKEAERVDGAHVVEPLDGSEANGCVFEAICVVATASARAFAHVGGCLRACGLRNTGCNPDFGPTELDHGIAPHFWTRVGEEIESRLDAFAQL